MEAEVVPTTVEVVRTDLLNQENSDRHNSLGIGKQDSSMGSQPLFGGELSYHRKDSSHDMHNEAVRETASFVDQHFGAILNRQPTFQDQKIDHDYTPVPFAVMLDREIETPRVKPTEVTPKSRPSVVSSEVEVQFSDSKGSRPQQLTQNRASDFTFKQQTVKKEGESDQQFTDFSNQADKALRLQKILESKKRLDQIKQRIQESKQPKAEVSSSPSNFAEMQNKVHLRKRSLEEEKFI